MIKKITNMMHDALGNAREFFNEHMKTMLYSPTPSFIMPQTEMLNPKMTKFYQQVFFNLPEYNKLINELYYNTGIIDSWTSSEKDISDTAAYIQTLDEYEKKDILEKINKQLRKNLLIKKHGLEISAKSPAFLKNQYEGGFSLFKRKTENKKEEIKVEKKEEKKGFFSLFKKKKPSTNTEQPRIEEQGKISQNQPDVTGQPRLERLGRIDKNQSISDPTSSEISKVNEAERQRKILEDNAIQAMINNIVDEVLKTNKQIINEKQQRDIKKGLYAKIREDRIKYDNAKRIELMKYLQKELPAIVSEIIYKHNEMKASSNTSSAYEENVEVYVPSFFLKELRKIDEQDEIINYDEEDEKSEGGSEISHDFEGKLDDFKHIAQQKGGLEDIKDQAVIKDQEETIGKVANTILGYTTAQKAVASRIKENEIKKVIHHPVFSPKFAETTLNDRLIFIAVTYIIRGICLFMLDWAINIKMVTTFEQSFNMYLTSYILVFVTLVILVNTSYSQTLNPFKLIFYYINADINGSMRIIVHLAIQLFLLPIMFIAKDKVQGSDNGIDTFEFRQKISRVISSVTMIIWLITSAIAVRL